MSTYGLRMLPRRDSRATEISDVLLIPNTSAQADSIKIIYYIHDTGTSSGGFELSIVAKSSLNKVGTCSSEELLLLQATFAAAALASQSHLGRTRLPTLQMFMSNIRKSADECLVAIQTLGTLNPGAIGLVHDFKI